MADSRWDGLTLINNVSDPKKRFEMHIEDKVAFVEYIISKQQIIYLTHTEVPQGLEGKGVGGAMVSKVLDFIVQSKLKMAPLCPFVAAYLKRHPTRATGILAPGYSIA
ncbi:GNAT family N-acetyltransferase [Spongiimicrobium sp. 3-5]|uniref:GNAT family N-acetyltransferase n=1 Tax=Spongiimicrobium sp. 3-5 TaxID=3332596 RepID=UPI00397F36B7